MPTKDELQAMAMSMYGLYWYDAPQTTTGSASVPQSLRHNIYMACLAVKNNDILSDIMTALDSIHTARAVNGYPV